MFKKIILPSMALLIFSGCSFNQANEDISVRPIKIVPEYKLLKDSDFEKPSWSNVVVDKNDYISSVGHSSSITQSYSKKKESAILNSKENFQKKLIKRIKNIKRGIQKDLNYSIDLDILRLANTTVLKYFTADSVVDITVSSDNNLIVYNLMSKSLISNILFELSVRNLKVEYNIELTDIQKRQLKEVIDRYL